MKSNLLHINLDKCCYMHFCPKAVKTKKDNFITEEHESSSLLDLDNSLNISGTSIPEVKNIKFLGVTIDNQLSWIPHIDNLHKKLKSATGILKWRLSMPVADLIFCLKRICNNIPQTHYKSLYYALFESHLSYCITVFGNVCKTHSEKLFTIQNHCMRILFGDKEAYLDKFITSCRTRPIETQLLGTAYYMKEHTKPIFHKHKILAFQNLYNYQICLETLKILKSKIPYYLFQLHPLSSKNNQNFLVAKRNSSLFITNRIKLWNNCVKVISNTQTIPGTKISKFKLDLKKILLKVQNEWNLEHNFSSSYQIISTI